MRRVDSKRGECLNVGISDRNRSARLVIDQSNSGANQILDDSNSSTPASTLEVELVTGKTLLERCNIERLDIIKIDVEGHEAQVLASIEPLIRQFRPRLILFECFDDLSDERQPVRQLLERTGYEITAMRKGLMGETTRSLVDTRRETLGRIDTYLAKVSVSGGEPTVVTRIG